MNSYHMIITNGDKDYKLEIEDACQVEVVDGRAVKIDGKTILRIPAAFTIISLSRI